jgi:hypothetical protein
VDVRLESITPQATEKLGGRSIRLRLNVRCDNGTVRLNFLDVYPGADLTGAPIHRAPPNTWAEPKPNSYVADAVRLACDKTFRGPFAAIAGASPSAAAKTTARPESNRVSAESAPALRARQPLSLEPLVHKSVSGADAAQIGAYSSAAASEEAWQALQTALPAQMSGLSKVTAPARAGGRTLYRTIVEGFPSTAAAASFCQALRASGRPCLLVKPVGP